MEYEFYIDLFFLFNGFFNVLALVLSGAILRQNTGALRISLAAAIGSFWNCFLIAVPVFSVWLELIFTVFAIGSLMIWLAFPKFMGPYGNVKRQCTGNKIPLHMIRQYVRADLVLIIASALVNGCFSLTLEQFHLSDVEALMFTGCLCGLVYEVLGFSLRQRKIGEERYHVRLHYRGQQREFLALADSGNRLQVPETGKPVVLISYQDCQGFCDHVSGGFFIPYRAVGTEQGLLFTMLFEKLEIIRDGQVYTMEDPAVAITKEGLSARGDFNMILPEEYVPGE